MIKAIIFDCFGVLITDALENMVADFRVNDPPKAAYITEQVAAASKGHIAPEVFRSRVAAIIGLAPEDYVRQIKDAEVKNQPLLDYILELRANYKTGLLSNVSRTGLDGRFTDEELARYFDAVVASGKVGFAKPEARAYELAASRLGVRLDECVMIDDREEYCRGAINTGMSAIRYRSFDQLKTDLPALVQQMQHQKAMTIAHEGAS